MHKDSGVILITCSGISNTGKLTAKTGEILMKRFPGCIDISLPARSDPEKLLHALSDADRIVIIDGCADCCGRKKVQEQGFEPDIHLVSTECGINKRGMEDPRFDEIEHLTSVVRKALR